MMWTSDRSVPRDLTGLSMNELGALTNRLFQELDRNFPNPETRTHYDRIVTELEAREAAADRKGLSSRF
ncbi:hypothetical protein [Paenarthrobacter sp. PH39-S1]|uniref:hypothetical protein n=2 Tax=Micrococcaceae TaxID=1268 RepID=UPI0024BA2417|nr:hypothetical protein [Paenarthrobacter sp. PH39-S1]